MTKTLWRTLAALALAGSACSLWAADAPDAKTFALVVGISKYQKLPQELWLQYPDADAKTLGEFLSSPRGGSLPADRLLVLNNEQATTGAIRNAFKTFLKGRVGKDDTVYVLIAGHGVADNTGAYILTYDSDPVNLPATGFSMGELHTLIDEQVNAAGHVILLADVCHAATIAGQKSTALGAVLEKLGEAPGEMLGLMAARPKEVSFESPEFGGGHGAFTWSVLRGLQGAADQDKDGFVTAGELIDFVSTDVSALTKDKQHPRDFGNMENATKLSDLSKPGLKLE